MQAMNLVPDQIILTRLLTEGRKKGDDWLRTCVVLRPFYATTNFAQTYALATPPANEILRRCQEDLTNNNALEQDKRLFWEQHFRGENDAYIKMLRHVFYANFFLAAVPRLDIDKYLPRFEVLVVEREGASSWETANAHLGRLISGIRLDGFDVSAEHSMFNSPAKLDVLPTLIIRVHDTVKQWAIELLARVQETIGYYLAKEIRDRRGRGFKIRPFSKQELEQLYGRLKRERDIRAGMGQQSPKLVND